MDRGTTPERRRRTLKPRTIAALAGVTLTLTACSSPETSSAGSPADGCEPYVVYAQNRWDPLGAAIRSEPDVNAEVIGGFVGNSQIEVDGWVEAAAAYPDNPELWQGDKWYRIADSEASQDDEWVNSAALRAGPTEHDPTGLSNFGGEPAPAPANCELAAEE